MTNAPMEGFDGMFGGYETSLHGIGYVIINNQLHRFTDKWHRDYLQGKLPCNQDREGSTLPSIRVAFFTGKAFRAFSMGISAAAKAARKIDDNETVAVMPILLETEYEPYIDQIHDDLIALGATTVVDLPTEQVKEQTCKCYTSGYCEWETF